MRMITRQFTFILLVFLLKSSNAYIYYFRDLSRCDVKNLEKINTRRRLFSAISCEIKKLKKIPAYYEILLVPCSGIFEFFFLLNLFEL